MRSSLNWLRAWIVYCQPAAETPFRLRQYLAASVTLPVLLLIYLILRCYVRLRGPLRMDAPIPGGAVLHCQLPDIVQFYVFLFGVWEPDISAFVQHRLSAGDTFCDIGSHVGYYSLLAANCVGLDGRVIAIEASPSVFQQLRENLEHNGMTQVRSVNIAASAEPGMLSIHRGPPWNLGWSTTHKDRGLPVECQVPSLPIDQILTEDERRTVRLIKVDVEGTERELFPGLQRLLRDARSDAEMILEISPLWWNESKTTVEQALQPFVEAGYHIYLVANDYAPWRYFWTNATRRPRRVRGPMKSWIGQYDVVLSRIDQEEL